MNHVTEDSAILLQCRLINSVVVIDTVFTTLLVLSDIYCLLLIILIENMSDMFSDRWCLCINRTLRCAAYC